MQEKISISIDKELISKADNLVNGKFIKKRSQAFEFIINEYFKGHGINHLVILGGGLNIKIDTQVVVENVKKLMKFDLKEVYIIGDKNFEHLKKELSKLKLDVYVVEEKKLMGTAGALNLIRGKINKTFFLIFINIKFDFNLNKMVELHKQNNSIATIGVTLTRKNTVPDNIIVEGNKIVAYNKTKNQFVNAGIYIFQPEIFSYLPKKGTFDKHIFPKLANEGKLFSYIITENWEYLG
ncbi:hypothetical protein CMO94_01305 [Candidatus Woesearchaeota archaeon]|jgi:mannose-1-phosphate guanylyltransferase|nr:hypothetical protein [Candidatus Woesearchaeota archaeon]MDP7244008.1 sugar phosphate nucleotidyltransferase [Flavobacteriales bacterium]